MTKAGKDHMGKVASLGCVLCRELYGVDSPAEVHHIGDAHQRSPWLTVPLCGLPNGGHHRGPHGFHGLGKRAFEARYKLGELELLALTIAALNGGKP